MAPIPAAAVVPPTFRLVGISTVAECKPGNPAGFYDARWLTDAGAVLRHHIAAPPHNIGVPSVYADLEANRNVCLHAPFGCFAPGTGPGMGKYPDGTVAKSDFRGPLSPAPGLDMAKLVVAVRALADHLHARGGRLMVNQGPRSDGAGSLTNAQKDAECKILADMGVDLVLNDMLGVTIQETANGAAIRTYEFESMVRLRDQWKKRPVAEMPEPIIPQYRPFWDGKWSISTSDAVLLRSMLDCYDFDTHQEKPAADRHPRFEYIFPAARSLYLEWFTWIQRGTIDRETRTKRIELARAAGTIPVVDYGDMTDAAYLAATGTAFPRGTGGPVDPPPPPPPTPTAGWTEIVVGPDTRRVFVDPAGNDANTGLAESSPKRTIAAGEALIRDASNDHLLLLKGGTWNEGLGHWKKSGESAAKRIIVGSYGTAMARPLLKTPGDQHGFARTGGGGAPPRLDHIAIIGVHLLHTGNVGNGTAGIWWLGPGSNLLVEDVKIEGFVNGLAVQKNDGRIANVSVRRCVVVDSYSTGDDHAQGFLAGGIDGLLIEENVFDHNGWREGDDPPDTRKHNLYIGTDNTGAVVRGNILSRASSHGLMLRCGGIIEGNVSLRNPIGLLLGGGDPDPITHTNGITGKVNDNVVLEGTDIDPANRRGFGIEITNVGDGGAEVARNIIANRQTTNPGYAIRATQSDYSSGVGIRNATVRDNKIAGWGSEAISKDAGIPAGALKESNNLVYPTSTRTLDTYLDYIDLEGGEPAFWEGIRNQQRGAYREKFTAEAIRQYIAGGFGP